MRHSLAIVTQGTSGQSPTGNTGFLESRCCDDIRSGNQAGLTRTCSRTHIEAFAAFAAFAALPGDLNPTLVHFDFDLDHAQPHSGGPLTVRVLAQDEREGGSASFDCRGGKHPARPVAEGMAGLLSPTGEPVLPTHAARTIDRPPHRAADADLKRRDDPFLPVPRCMP